MNKSNSIWVFNGVGANYPVAIFSSIEIAEHWIEKNGVSGLLTNYPIDVSVYDWVIDKGYFEPKTDSKKTPEFIQKFSSGYLEHFHYINGKCEN